MLFYTTHGAVGHYESAIMSIAQFTESVVEQAALAWLESTGWRVRNGAAIAATPLFAERIA